MLRISVIVAVYNIAPYVRACLDSIAVAALPEAEILVIDDGSTDGSAEICDKFGEECENALVFHKPNGGLSDARNFGLKRAEGKWVLFIDGDDRVIPDKFHEFARELALSQADIVLNDFVLCSFQNNRKRESRQVTTGAGLERALSAPGPLWNVWRYGYRREFLIQNCLEFKTGIVAEDMDFTARILSMPGLKFECLRVPYYLYFYQRSGSITQEGSLWFIQCMTGVVQTEYLRLLGRKDTVAGLVRKKLLRDYVCHGGKVYGFHGEERRRFIGYYKRASIPISPLPLAPFFYVIRRVYHLVRQR